MTTLWLVRHGETNWNVEHRFQGSSDQPLNQNGESQATALSNRLDKMSFDAMYCSDLIRVQRTAELALNGNIDRLVLDARLQEFNFGKWEGLSWKEARELDSVAFDEWASDRENNPHGGERISDMVTRLDSFLSDLQEKHDKDEQILIFAHGGTLGSLLCLLLGNDPKHWWHYRFLNCSLSQVELLNRGAVLVRLNDTGHFPDSD